ncbi:MAG: menaquinone biosynthesis protein [Bacteroidota bacterium]|nr:menaquinone biosynthesis protein [Bacteroidota bacterium]
MQTKIRVGAVSYLNTKPLIYGFEKGMMKNEIELVIDYPSKIASMLLENKIDVGLVPVAIIPKMKEYHIISDYCIGCDGEVASVCLFSEVPLAKIEKILLDYQSRSSVALLKELIKNYWKIEVIIEEASENYQSGISGTTAGLVIGDRALQQRKISPYIYDLGMEWKKYTGIPFVFAAWISNKALANDFIIAFNKANSFGLNNIEEVVSKNPYSIFDLKHYYTNCISFDLNDGKKRGLEFFLKKLKNNL